ncbi:UTRA domain-containing protein [Collinsella intestinalis]|uniref:UTRA domain-containing protein n=1 Tax=Collinsella intestinalis TaxID=147207 RepID=UPI00195AF457|nr:UTRA domain-containing protein [Collinsella intestinalis]
MYRRLREDHGLFLSREASHEVTRIVMPADGEVRSALSLAEAEPCVRKERCTTLPDGTVAEYVVMHRRWDYFELTIDESFH